jgi:hypothetical protein
VHAFAISLDGYGVDDQFAARGFENIGATIMGRNMFGPIRGVIGPSGRRRLRPAR